MGGDIKMERLRLFDDEGMDGRTKIEASICPTK